MKVDVREIKYEPEDDVLNVYFSKNEIDDAFEVDNAKSLAVMHVDKNKKPVYLEVFEASRFFNVNLRNLPEKIRQEFFAPV